LPIEKLNVLVFVNSLILIAIQDTFGIESVVVKKVYKKTIFKY